ncbi:MAG: hypothetical protein V4733_06235 [Verrucomicrobiota bacterium]
MTVRSIVGLFLGLVLQVSLVVPAGACVAAERCEMSSCSCCEGAESCPCIKSSDGDFEVPVSALPPLPAKVNAIAPSQTIPLVPIAEWEIERETASEILTFTAGGYRGVALCVSFCRLVI